MTTPPAGPQDEKKEAAVRGGAPAALREALTAMLGEVGFMRSCIASGERLTQADLDRQNPAMARAIQLLSENTVDSLDELDVERLAEAMTWWHRDGWREVPDDVLWPSRNRDYAADTANEDRIAAAAILRRLAVTAASDASEEETNG